MAAATTTAMTKAKSKVKEAFAIADVGTPLSKKNALGDAQGMGGGGLRGRGFIFEKALRCPTCLNGENDDVKLTHGVFSQRLSFRRNSLVTEAQKNG